MADPRPQRGYGNAAPTYIGAGWQPFPLPAGKKSPPPVGYTGAGGKAPTSQDVLRWQRSNAHGNIGLHLDDTTIGVDVDDYEGKEGGATLAALEQQHGPLPATWSSTSRGEGVSRISFYRIPAGVTFPGVLGTGIDVIQAHHRYAVVAPSTHPDSGERYRWYTPEGQVATAPPRVADLPPLPQRWVDELQWRPHAIETPTQAKPAPSSDDSIAARVADEHRWHDVLIADGWQHANNRGADSQWTRPGKDARQGISAVLHEPDGPLMVFTTSVAALQQPWATTSDAHGWAYSMFGYLAATRHGGDRSACARDYRLQANATDAQYRTLQTATTAVRTLDDEEAPEDDWGRIDLAEIARAMRSGDYQPTMPTVLAVNGGLPLFYPARVNSIFGESGGGKTWVALAAVAEVARGGERALMIDWEDNPQGITERLVLLGLDDDEIGQVDYRNPTTSIGYGVAGLQALADTYALIVIDSTGEAMAAGGVDSNDDGGVAQWFAVVKQLCRLPGGPAVIVLDHVPKSTDAPSSYAIGSQRKRAAVTGAAYRVDTIKEPAKGKDGRLKLSVAKDRPGNRSKGSTAAIIEVRSVDASVELELHLTDAQAAEAAGEPFRPTVYMERVSRWLELNPASTTNAVIAGVPGRKEIVREAISVLLAEGFLVVEIGARNAAHYRVVTSYREGMKSAQPVDNSDWDHDRGTGSRPGPDRVPGPGQTVESTGALGPTPLGGTQCPGRETPPGVDDQKTTGSRRDPVNPPPVDKSAPYEEPDW